MTLYSGTQSSLILYHFINCRATVLCWVPKLCHEFWRRIYWRIKLNYKCKCMNDSICSSGKEENIFRYNRYVWNKRSFPPTIFLFTFWTVYLLGRLSPEQRGSTRFAVRNPGLFTFSFIARVMWFIKSIFMIWNL